MKKKKLERRIKALEEWRLAETSAFNNRDALGFRIRITASYLQGQLDALGENLERIERKIDPEKYAKLDAIRAAVE